jgi:hypothetical protein
MTFVIGTWLPTGEVGNISMVAQDHEVPLYQRILLVSSSYFVREICSTYQLDVEPPCSVKMYPRHSVAGRHSPVAATARSQQVA